jgi:hypothetical protein
VAKATVEDLRQMFEASVCIYKNKPYFILHIGLGRKCRARNLLSQREEDFLIDEENTTAPTQRLGFINVQGCVLYASRLPVRRYKAGLTRENLRLENVPYAPAPGRGDQIGYISSLTSVELGDCIQGKYPDIGKAFEMAVEYKGTFAFDRQFAIDNAGRVYYKTSRVGTVTRPPKTIDDIKFSEGFAHLTTLLGKNYETVFSIAR